MPCNDDIIDQLNQQLEADVDRSLTQMQAELDAEIAAAYKVKRAERISIGHGDTPEEANRMAEDALGPGRPIKDSDLEPETIARRGKLIEQIQQRFPAGTLVPVELSAAADSSPYGPEMQARINQLIAEDKAKLERSADQFNEPLLQLFKYEHLPQDVQIISAQFHSVAHFIVANLPRNPERSVALRKLREAKDAAITAKLWKEVG